MRRPSWIDRAIALGLGLLMGALFNAPAEPDQSAEAEDRARATARRS